MLSFAKRLDLIIKELGYSKNGFINELGYKNNSVIYDYTSEKEGSSKPGIEFVEKMIQVFPGINLNFLFTGNGDALVKKGTAATNIDEAAVREELRKMRLEIEFLRARNTELTQSVLNLSGGKVVEHR